MYYLWVILKRDLASNPITKGRSMKERLGAIMGATVFLGLGVLAGWGSRTLFRYLETSLSVLPPLRVAVEINFLSAIGIFILMMFVMSGFQIIYKVVYESDDIGFLLSQPVPVWSVFAAKFLSSFVSLTAMTAVFALPAWIGFGLVRGLPWTFHLLALIAFMMALLTIHSIVTLLLLVAMRYLSGRRMKQMFIAVTAILGIGVVVISQLISSAGARTTDPFQMIEAMGRGQLAKLWFLPTSWMTNAVLGTIGEFQLNPYGGWVALLLGSVLGTSLAIVASNRWYLLGWSGRTEETTRSRPKKNAARARAKGPAVQLSPWASILRKDLVGLFRDPMLWYTLVVATIGLGFFAYNMSSTLKSVGDDAMVITHVMMVAMPLFMGSVAGSQTGGVSISREGPSFWVLRSNPVHARDLMRAKFVYAVLPVLFFALAFPVGLAVFKIPSVPLVTGLFLGVIGAVAVASFQLLFDVYKPDFTLKVEMGSTKAGRGQGKLLLTMFSSMGLIVLLGFILAIPGIMEGKVASLTEESWIAISRGVFCLVAFVLSGILFTAGHKRLSKLLSDIA